MYVPIAKLEFIGLSASGQTEKLITQADTKYGYWILFG